MKTQLSRNKREGHYLGKRGGQHFRHRGDYCVGEDLPLFAVWCFRFYEWRDEASYKFVAKKHVGKFFS